MFGFGKKKHASSETAGPQVSTKLCTDKFNGKYPHVGLYDCREKRVWVAKPLAGQAIRTSHARLITGSDNATSTVWKDRFLCFWFYTPNTGSGHILGYPIDWTDAHLLVRVDPQWDYDRQRLIPGELSDQIDANLERQIRHGLRIWEFFVAAKHPYPICLHLVGQRASESQFYLKRVEAGGISTTPALE
ncbi:MAG TPA: hypothetical protein VGB55_13455 [Tepidisphaeraceae bacterium]|jgi:hypothetical protein